MNVDSDLAVSTHPPAKLNFFLEVTGRRQDGFHDIDTVMSPINWCDRLTVRRTAEPGIKLRCKWASEYSGIVMQPGDPGQERTLLDIPSGPSNLVHQALGRFADAYSVTGGWDCELEKQIPAGAGMGGASSDAASALLSAAALCDIDPNDAVINQIAAAIGSDVPFFLGQPNHSGSQDKPGTTPEPRRRLDNLAARAVGRGTDLQAVPIGFRPSLVVAYPGVSLSTARVYQQCSVPATAKTADLFLRAWQAGDTQGFCDGMMNRLALPARKLSRAVDELLEFMGDCDVRGYQLTGSGSACFAVAASADQAIRVAGQLGATGRVIARAVTLTRVPAPLRLHRH